MAIGFMPRQQKLPKIETTSGSRTWKDCRSSVRWLSEELIPKNYEKYNSEGLQSKVPAQKLAYTMPEITINFCSFRANLLVSTPSLAIIEGQATAITAYKTFIAHICMLLKKKNHPTRLPRIYYACHNTSCTYLSS